MLLNPYQFTSDASYRARNPVCPSGLAVLQIVAVVLMILVELPTLGPRMAFVHQVACVGAPCFLMVSGYVLVRAWDHGFRSRTFWLRQVVRVIFPLFLWFAVYALFALVTHAYIDLSPLWFLYSLLQGIVCLWFGLRFYSLAVVMAYAAPLYLCVVLVASFGHFIWPYPPCELEMGCLPAVFFMALGGFFARARALPSIYESGAWASCGLFLQLYLALLLERYCAFPFASHSFLPGTGLFASGVFCVFLLSSGSGRVVWLNRLSVGTYAISPLFLILLSGFPCLHAPYLLLPAVLAFSVASLWLLSQVPYLGGVVS